MPKLTTLPGPPLWKDGPDPTNKPAPIEPPACRQNSKCRRWVWVRQRTDSNHLHMAALELLMKQALRGLLKGLALMAGFLIAVLGADALLLGSVHDELAVQKKP